MNNSRLLKILPEVKRALSLHKPVVALESTILSHGLPHPENVQLASDLSGIIRGIGEAVPATVALKNGSCCVGLTKQDIKSLCQKGSNEVMKCSTRDIPIFLSQMGESDCDGNDSWGATTVASTMRLAHLAGVNTFVTGGIGGVHRGAEISMDISADLMELSRTPIVVVSAGIKSILDIGLSLEMLESVSVPVLVYGSNEFPSFFSPKSGFPAPARVNSAKEVAAAYWASRELGLRNGILVTVPNPDPAGAEIELAITEALEESHKLDLKGKAVTPFLLKRVSEMTSGMSLRSNLSLVKHNAVIGAEIATEIMKMGKERKNNWTTSVPIDLAKPNKEKLNRIKEVTKVVDRKVIVVGASVIDVIARSDQKIIMGTSNPGGYRESQGGVGRNIAEALGRLGTKTVFYTAIGNDEKGTTLIENLETKYNIFTKFICTSDKTAFYFAILDNNGELQTAIADMNVNENIPSPTETELQGAKMLVIDANAPISNLATASLSAFKMNIPIFLETTSAPKASLISESDILKTVTFVSPNYDELFSLAQIEDVKGKKLNLSDQLQRLEADEDLPIKLAASRVIGNMNPSNAHILITLGEFGVLRVSRTAPSSCLKYIHYEAPKPKFVKNVTGAGDTFAAAFVHEFVQNQDVDTAILFALRAAKLSIECEHSAIPNLETL